MKIPASLHQLFGARFLQEDAVHISYQREDEIQIFLNLFGKVHIWGKILALRPSLSWVQGTFYNTSRNKT